MKIKLDKKEQKIERALEKGEYVSSKNLKERKNLFAEAARNYTDLQKSKPITIRIKNEDLIKVKAKAAKSGIPYQTLLNALIHQYAEEKTSLEF